MFWMFEGVLRVSHLCSLKLLIQEAALAPELCSAAAKRFIANQAAGPAPGFKVKAAARSSTLINTGDVSGRLGEAC